MSHYDCKYCGAGIYDNHSHDCSDMMTEDRERASLVTYIIKPPLGLRPKYIVDELRIREIEEAIGRCVLAGKAVPLIWQQELFDLRGSTF